MAQYNIKVLPEPSGLWTFRVEEEGGSLTASYGGHSSKNSAKNAAETYVESLSEAETYVFNTVT